MLEMSMNENLSSNPLKELTEELMTLSSLPNGEWQV